jgi:hypothetical protein
MLVSRIGLAADALAGVPGQIGGLGVPLEGPLLEASTVAGHAAVVLTQLRSGVRAATVGESLLDRVIPSGGTVGKIIRSRIAPDREAADLSEVEAAVEFERASARRSARSDAEARRAAMAELDALDDW